MAELKRQLEARPTNKDFDGSEWVSKVVMEAMKSNRGRMLEIIQEESKQRKEAK